MKELLKHNQYALCKECEATGLPSGFHSVSRDDDFIYVNCSTCGKLVVKLKLGDRK